MTKDKPDLIIWPETATPFFFQDDVLLEPAASELEPAEADIRSKFSKRIALNIPLVSSAMDTVTEAVMAIALAREGGIGVIHRNMMPERELQEVNAVKQAEELIEREVLFVEETATVADAEQLMSQRLRCGIPSITSRPRPRL